MKRFISLLLLFSLSISLFSCKKEEENKSSFAVHVSEPLASISYAVAFRRADSELAEEFDRILGEVMADGTASRLCEVHTGADNIAKDPKPANIRKDEDDDSLSRVYEAGKIVIGYHNQHRPMVWVDSSDKAVGLDAELAKEIGRRMGLTVEFKIIEWQRVDIALEGGSVDAIFSAFEYTEERAQSFNLTRTYLDTELVLISREDTPYDSISELSDKKLCISEGIYTGSLLDGSTATVLPFSSNENALERIKNKTCDALLANALFASYIQENR